MMTLNQTAQRPTGFIDSAVSRLREGGVLVAKLGIAGLIIIAAGVLAVATAVAGLVIASIALLFRFIGRNRAGYSATPRQSEGWTDATGITLEARSTSRGWTVE
jgi:hypothetical protein